jgi:hypothetical protein
MALVNYTVNFTTAMTDANYSVAGAVGGTKPSYVFNLKGTTSLQQQHLVLLTC